jgi:hypothetical protein
MTEDTRNSLLDSLRRLKDQLAGHPDFDADDSIRHAFVIVTTAEGAIQFGDEAELAQVCVDFAGEKAERLGRPEGNGQRPPA